MADARGNFEVFETEYSGRGLRAIRFLHPGDPLIVEHPGVFVLSNSVRGERCDFCFAAKTTLQKCSICKFARYCGRECQKKAWKEHKIECRRLINVFPRLPTATVRLIGRVLSAKARDSIPWFESLVSHQDDFDDFRREEFSAILFVLQQFLGEEVAEQTSPAEIFELFGRISCNSFTICDVEMEPLGIGIYHSGSLVNHSCRPNCVAVFDGTELTIHVTEEIQPKEELTISYTELMLPSVKRKEELKRQYFFDCHCVRCSCADEEDGMLMSMKCSKPGCDGMVSGSLMSQIMLGNEPPIPTYGSWMDMLVCQLCKTKLSPDVLANDSSTLLAVAEALAFGDQHNNPGAMQGYRDHSENILAKLKENLHQNNYLVSLTTAITMDGCIALGDWNKALTNGLQSLQAFEKFYPRYHPSIGIQLFKIGKIQLYLGHLQEGIHSLERGKAILSVTHGNKHPILHQLNEYLIRSSEELMAINRSTRE